MIILFYPKPKCHAFPRLSRQTRQDLKVKKTRIIHLEFCAISWIHTSWVYFIYGLYAKSRRKHVIDTKVPDINSQNSCFCYSRNRQQQQPKVVGIDLFTSGSLPFFSSFCKCSLLYLQLKIVRTLHAHTLHNSPAPSPTYFFSQKSKKSF